MEKFIEKISSYNLLNNLLPGAVFCYLINKVAATNLLTSNTIENLFVYYFIGMVISRVGSIIIEPLFKKIKFVVYAPYNKFLVASAKDDKINILLEVNNLYRTMLSMTLLLMLYKLYVFCATYIIFLSVNSWIIFVAGLCILFALSYRKQTNYIRRRVEKKAESIDK